MTRRDRCYGCFRPQEDCFCSEIPTIDNETSVLILQHRRERFHPFNTARIVRKALRNSHLVAGGPQVLAAAPFALGTRAGLLYPSPAAALLVDLPADQRPDQLVVLDGTWHHAKTMFRDIPWLRELPQYGLAPSVPGRYRIRREPDARSLSTLEAVVAALQTLEPDTGGLDQLLEAFKAMVDRQLARCQTKTAWRRNQHRLGLGVNIPRVLADDSAPVVVAYGESAPGGRGSKAGSLPPVYWVAERLVTGERFALAIQPESPLSDAFLSRLELTEEDLSGAVCPDAFCDAWANFLHPAEILVVYHPGTLRLLTQVGARVGSSVVLKSVQSGTEIRNGSLQDRLASEGLTPGPVEHPGRAGRRLAQTIALVHHLQALGIRMRTASGSSRLAAPG